MARVDPFKNFRFLVEIDGITQAGFADCSGFGSNVEVVEDREGGRRDPLSTDKGKSELVFLNVWLHIHPAKVKKENMKFRYSFYLGFITFFLFLILLTTGIALMCYYRP